jgi:hypothetical protein
MLLLETVLRNYCKAKAGCGYNGIKSIKQLTRELFQVLKEQLLL